MSIANNDITLRRSKGLSLTYDEMDDNFAILEARIIEGTGGDRFEDHTTSDLAEGSNLYFTNARADARVNALVDKAYVDGLGVSASTADRLSTARTIALSGDVSGSASFDGSGNITITTTVEGSEHTHSVTDIDEFSLDGEALRYTNSNGYIDIGPKNSTYSHIYSNLPFYFNRDLYVTGSKVYHDDYHPSADKLTTARTITVNGDATGSISFDGSSNKTLTLSVLGYDAHRHNVSNIDGLQGELDDKLDATAQALDSDKLDGLHASDFATSAQGTKADNALPNTGGVVTGDIEIEKTSGVAKIKFNNPNAYRDNYIGMSASDNLVIAADESNLGTLSSIQFRVDGAESGRFDDNGNFVTTGNIVTGGTVDGRDIVVDGTKLDGIAAQATKNATDAQLRDRSTHTGTQAISTVSGLQSALDDKINLSEKGTANGVASLNSSGIVPANQLPSFVDDVLEFANFAAFPTTGESGKIYIDEAESDVYRWSGSGYIQINDAVSSADQATRLATPRNITLGGDLSGSVSFDGSSNVTLNATATKATGNFTVGGTLISNGTSSRNKIYVYSAAPYAIGMQSGVNYGSLNSDWAMTFQMNNDADRGFWWGDDGQSTAQGAMSLSTNGKLTVASNIRVGYGQDDTVVPSDKALDVKGDSLLDGDVKILTGRGLAIEHSTTHGLIVAPGGGFFRASGNVTGAIKIVLPLSIPTYDMSSFWVDIYNFIEDTSISLFISGYLYLTDIPWTNVTAKIIGNEDIPVRFGKTTDEKYCVWIGETTSTWKYPQVVVRDVQAGHTALMDEYVNGWSVSTTTSFDTVYKTKSNNLVNSYQTEKLKTARTIALSGDVSGSASFDGSGNITITATIADDSHNHTIANVDGLQTALDGKLGSTAKAADSDKLDGLNSTQFLRSDITNSDYLKTDITSGKVVVAAGDFSDLLGINDSVGGAYIGKSQYWIRTGNANYGPRVQRGSSTLYDIWHEGNDGAGSGLDADLLDGKHASEFLDATANAVSASKLATARTIALSGDVSGSASFDGSGNITITAAVADDSHNHTIANVDGLQTALDGKASTTHNHDSDYLSWGVSGSVDVNAANDTGLYTGTTSSWTNRGPSGHNGGALLSMHTHSGNYYSQMWFDTGGQGVYHRHASASLPTGAWQRMFADDYHPNADKLTTARTIALSGDVSGSASFDGSGNITINTTVAENEPTILTSADNLNTLSNGWYAWAGSVPTNAPCDYGILHQIEDTAQQQQMLWSGYSAELYTRRKNSGTWSGWSGYATTSALNNGLAGKANTSHTHSLEDVDGLSTANASMRYQNGNGYIEIGPKNTSYSHIYTDRPSFYFNKDLLVLGKKVFHDDYHPNADKLTTARTISLSGDVSGSVSFDGSSNVTLTATIPDNYVQMSTQYSYSVSSENWVTIATLSTGRAYGEFYVYDMYSGRHNFVKIVASSSYGQNNVSVIGGIRYGTRTIAHVRILYNSSDRVYGGAKLQVYCENPTYTMYIKAISQQNFSGWNEWTVATVSEGTPSGWLEDATTRFDDITNPNTSFTGSFDGDGSLLSSVDADKLDGLNSTSFLRSDTDDTLDGVLTISTADVYALKLYSTVNANQVGIEFSDQINTQAQKGFITFAHSDGVAGNGKSAAFIFDTTEPHLGVNLPTTGDIYRGSERFYHDGYHPNADKLTTPRTIALSGDVSGSASFDGSGNITITATVADDSHNHTIANVDGLQTALDGKLGSTAKAADSNLLDGLDSTKFMRSDIDETMPNMLTMTNTLRIDQAGNNGNIAYETSGGCCIPMPLGGNYKTTGSAKTGAIAIKLPTASSGQSDMLSFHVDIFDYAGGVDGESVTLYIYGYQYSTASWTNCGAVITSDRSDRDYTVRFGHDGSRPIVYIGETTTTWNYPQVIVKDFQAGYSASYANYDNAFAIGFETTLQGVARTSSANYPVAKQLGTARTISLGGDVSGSVSFDGSSNVTITATVADDSHNHTIANVDGLQTALDGKLGSTAKAADSDKLDGLNSTQFLRSDAGNAFDVRLTSGHGRGLRFWDSDSYKIYMSVDTDPTYGGGISTEGDYNLYYKITGSGRGHVFLNSTTPVAHITGSGKVYATGEIYANTNQRVFADNYHPNADKLTTARTISLSGDVSGSVSFNGSSNVTMTTSIADDSHNHVISNVDGLQSALDGKINTTGGTFTGAVKVKELQEIRATVVGTSATIDLHLATVFKITLSGNTAFTFSNPPPSGTAGGFTLIVVGGGSYTTTYPAGTVWSGGTTPAPPASGEISVYTFFTEDGGSTWYGFEAGKSMA